MYLIDNGSIDEWNRTFLSYRANQGDSDREVIEDAIIDLLIVSCDPDPLTSLGMWSSS